jgi:hypothetical protein
MIAMAVDNYNAGGDIFSGRDEQPNENAIRDINSRLQNALKDYRDEIHHIKVDTGNKTIEVVLDSRVNGDYEEHVTKEIAEALCNEFGGEWNK